MRKLVAKFLTLVISITLLTVFFSFFNSKRVYAQGTCVCEGFLSCTLQTNNCAPGYTPLCEPICVAWDPNDCSCLPPNTFNCEYIGGPGVACVPDSGTSTCDGANGYQTDRDYCASFFEPGNPDRCNNAPRTTCTFVGRCSDLGGTCRIVTGPPGCGSGFESRGVLDCNASIGEVCCAPVHHGVLDPRCETNPGAINTAIGCIPVANTQEFTQFLLSWGAGIAGGIAILLIIYGGYLVVTSSGNPQKLQAGKELITSAVMGLLLLMLGAFILRLIGVNILQLPEFGP